MKLLCIRAPKNFSEEVHGPLPVVDDIYTPVGDVKYNGITYYYLEELHPEDAWLADLFVPVPDIDIDELMDSLPQVEKGYKEIRILEPA